MAKAIWDNRRERLVWVDIVSRAIHPFTPKTSEDHFWSTLEMPTSIRLRAVGGAIGGILKTLALWDYDNEFREIAEVEPRLQENRFNEGVIGPVCSGFDDYLREGGRDAQSCRRSIARLEIASAEFARMGEFLLYPCPQLRC